MADVYFNVWVARSVMAEGEGHGMTGPCVHKLDKLENFEKHCSSKDYSHGVVPGF